MLVKLLKHEMKASSRLILPLLYVLLVLTILNRIIFELPLFHGILSIIPTFTTFIYIVTMIIIIVVCMVIVIYRFYKNLITDEGYLMFTLPVKPHQLINSKLLISVFWIFISAIAVLASLYIVLVTPEQFQMIRDQLTAARNSFRSEFGPDGVLFLVEMLIAMLFGTFYSILQIYASIAIGQLFSGHKILGSFTVYIAFSTIFQMIWLMLIFISGLLFGASMKSINDIYIITHVIYPIAMLFICITGVLYYLITNYIFQKKLNLE